jgi:hypothetical protein
MHTERGWSSVTLIVDQNCIIPLTPQDNTNSGEAQHYQNAVNAAHPIIDENRDIETDVPDVIDMLIFDDELGTDHSL